MRKTPKHLGIAGKSCRDSLRAGMVNLYARVGTIEDSVAPTQAQIDKQVEHCVDREEYLRRDREIQRALERMATMDELRDVNDTLLSIQESISPSSLAAFFPALRVRSGEAKVSWNWARRYSMRWKICCLIPPQSPTLKLRSTEVFCAQRQTEWARGLQPRGNRIFD